MSNITSQNRIAYQIDKLTGIPDPPKRSNAPVTRALWMCENLPDGLSLSLDTGMISGRPTTAGSYDCEIKISTNWGSASKTVKIKVAATS